MNLPLRKLRSAPSSRLPQPFRSRATINNDFLLALDAPSPIQARDTGGLLVGSRRPPVLPLLDKAAAMPLAKGDLDGF